MTEYSLPDKLLSELNNINWLEPWVCICKESPDEGKALEEELQKELSDNHVLYPHRLIARAIARREDCDDVLFWMPDVEERFAIVHLTWNSHPEIDPVFPETTFHNSLSDFVTDDLIPAHREWSAG